MPKFVDIETPYNGHTLKDVARNIKYARACVRDSLMRGEVPYASHIFYTQTGILDDNVPAEREIGILAGKQITEKLCAITVVYTDLGISKGMVFGINLAAKMGREIVYRNLGEGWEAEFSVREAKHSHREVW